jgi:hypothetical protein
MQGKRGHNYKTLCQGYLLFFLLCQGFSKIFSGIALNEFENFKVMYLNIKPETGNTGDSGDGLQSVANNTAHQQTYVRHLRFIYLLKFLSLLIFRYLNHAVIQ